MAEVTKFEAEKIGDNVIMRMEVTSGGNVWPGAKAVPVGSNLQIEGEILAKEIIDANAPKVVAPEPEATPVDVSNINIEIK